MQCLYLYATSQVKTFVFKSVATKFAKDFIFLRVDDIIADKEKKINIYKTNKLSNPRHLHTVGLEFVKYDEMKMLNDLRHSLF